MTFPSGSDLDAAFVVAAWRGREALSEGLEHALDLLTEDAGRPLQTLVGLHQTFERLATSFKLKADTE